MEEENYKVLICSRWCGCVCDHYDCGDCICCDVHCDCCDMNYFLLASNFIIYYVSY